MVFGAVTHLPSLAELLNHCYAEDIDYAGLSMGQLSRCEGTANVRVPRP